MSYKKPIWKEVKRNKHPMGVLSGYMAQLSEDSLIDIYSIPSQHLNWYHRLWNWIKRFIKDKNYYKL